MRNRRWKSIVLVLVSVVMMAGLDPANAFAALGAASDDQPTAELALTMQAPDDGGVYTDSAYAEYQIEEASADKIDISNAVVSVEESTYTGEAAQPSVTVTLDGRKMIPGEEYTVDYGNFVDAGDAKVIVHGTGIYEGRSKSLTPFIKRALPMRS